MAFHILGIHFVKPGTFETYFEAMAHTRVIQVKRPIANPADLLLADSQENAVEALRELLPYKPADNNGPLPIVFGKGSEKAFDWGSEMEEIYDPKEVRRIGTTKWLDFFNSLTVRSGLRIPIYV